MVKLEVINTIKGYEKEFLEANFELYKNDRISFLKQREEFVSKKIEESKEDEEE